jgi:hypothetical protein
VIFLPNFLWQIQHHFVSLEFLKSIHARDIRMGRTDSFVLDQFWIATNPATVPLWLAGLFYLFAAQDGNRYRPIGWMFVIPFLLFIIGRGRVLHGPGLSHVARCRGGMGRAVGCFVEFAAHPRNPEDYLDGSCNWGLGRCRDCSANCTARIIVVAVR